MSGQKNNVLHCLFRYRNVSYLRVSDDYRSLHKTEENISKLIARKQNVFESEHGNMSTVS